MLKSLLVAELSLAEFAYPFPWWSPLMFAFLIMLGIVYVAKAAWPKLVSNGVAPMDWAWPVTLFMKLFPDGRD